MWKALERWWGNARDAGARWHVIEIDISSSEEEGVNVKRFLILIVVPVLLVTTGTIPAIGHRTREFDACVT